MPASEMTTLIQKGVAALKEGNTLVAMIHFEDAAKLEDTPTVRSYLAFCLAKERQQMTKAISLCLTAMQQEPTRALHCLNLGRIYLMAGQKTRAIQTFRKGLKLERNQQIIDELKNLGLRQPPVLKTLSRDHPLNKCLGILFQKMGMR
jgi:tetratricopeptide (TPR) repeat protein